MQIRTDMETRAPVPVPPPDKLPRHPVVRWSVTLYLDPLRAVPLEVWSSRRPAKHDFIHLAPAGSRIVKVEVCRG